MSGDTTEHTGYDAAQLSHRSRHGGLEWEQVRVGQRTIRHNLRAVADKRLIDALTDEQQMAMWAINRAWVILTAGLGMKICDPAAVRGGTGDIHHGAASLLQYFQWATDVQKRRLDHSMALDLIGFGMSLREVDRNRRQPRGTAKGNLIATLKLWK